MAAGSFLRHGRARGGICPSGGRGGEAVLKLQGLHSDRVLSLFINTAHHLQLYQPARTPPTTLSNNDPISKMDFLKKGAEMMNKGQNSNNNNNNQAGGSAPAAGNNNAGSEDYGDKGMFSLSQIIPFLSSIRLPLQISTA